jgi:ribosomal protein S18 acetylase RimI-like enzyme
VRIVALGPGDEDKVKQAAGLFDAPARDEATTRFLNDAGHHLLIAYQDGRPAGFVSGVELTHPDKGTEMFLYELAVDEAFRRRGIGRALAAALAGLARQRGCYGMFVLTDDDNQAAQATYLSAGAAREADRVVLLSWSGLA